MLHVWNHALFKALLFLSAGSVIHATHTREIDHLGGLAKAMPRTALCFLVGAVAICGLPPLNGFVSEFLIYLGLFGTLADVERAVVRWSRAFAAPALALIGALAVACFVKVYGAVFLGTARSEHAQPRARVAARRMLAPMGVLVACCFLIGLAPLPGRPGPRAMGCRPGRPDLNGRGPAPRRAGPARRGSRVMGLRPARRPVARRRCAAAAARPPRSSRHGATWGCGYAAPTPRMQYTSSSFAQMLVGTVRLGAPPAHARARATCRCSRRRPRFHSEVPDTVLDEAVLPAFRFGAWLFSLVPRVPAGEHPDLPALHLPRPDRPAALALEGT